MGEGGREKKGWWGMCFSSCPDYESISNAETFLPQGEHNMSLKITMYNTLLRMCVMLVDAVEAGGRKG